MQYTLHAHWISTRCVLKDVQKNKKGTVHLNNSKFICSCSCGRSLRTLILGMAVMAVLDSLNSSFSRISTLTNIWLNVPWQVEPQPDPFGIHQQASGIILA